MSWLGLPLALLVSGGLPTRPVTVPIELQAELLSKVVRYDRNFQARAGTEALVLVVFDRRDSGSKHAATQLVEALRGQEKMGGVPVRVLLEEFSSPEALAASAGVRRCAVVVLGPGLEAEVAAIASAFSASSFDGLTVTMTSGVEAGAVLGFDLASGKPRMFLNLAQARRQRVAFHADVLRLMKVVE